MNLSFWRRQKKEEIAAAGQTAASIHRSNIDKIVKSREKVVELNRVLRQNNIIIELAKAMGH